MHLVLDEPEQVLPGQVLQHVVDGLGVHKGVFQAHEEVFHLAGSQLHQERLLILQMLDPLVLLNGALGNPLERMQLLLVDDQLHWPILPISNLDIGSAVDDFFGFFLFLRVLFLLLLLQNISFVIHLF